MTEETRQAFFSREAIIAALGFKPTDEGISHKDQYRCDCKALVSEEDWSEEYKCCVDCYLEKMERTAHGG